MKRAHLAAVAAAACLLTVPPAASAAGTVGSNTMGDLTYTGDGGPNVVTAIVTPTGTVSAKVVFSEPGITEGTDTKSICTPSAGFVTCSYDLTRYLTLTGEAGNDKITLDSAEEGATISGGDGDDDLTGGDGIDRITAEGQNDRLDGRGSGDLLQGGNGTDVVVGGDGGDSVITDLDDGDQFFLGAGNDTVEATNQDGTGETIDGGTGVDTIVFYSEGNPGLKPGAVVDLASGVLSWKAFDPYPATTDSLVSIEDVGEYNTSSGNDTLIGDAGSNLLAGGAGSDTITGGAGADRIEGDKAFYGLDYLVPTTGARDTIDSVDGFADRIDCGPEADTLTADQFDGATTSACETVETRTADPFGIAPQPTTPSGQQPEPQQPQRDVRAPVCTPAKIGGLKRSAFVKRGFSLAFTCDEQARIDVSSSQGKLVVATTSTEVAAGKRSLKFKVPRQLRRVLGKKFTVRVRIDATDAAGNRSTAFASFKVK